MGKMPVYLFRSPEQNWFPECLMECCSVCGDCFHSSALHYFVRRINNLWSVQHCSRASAVHLGGCCCPCSRTITPFSLPAACVSLPAFRCCPQWQTLILWLAHCSQQRKMKATRCVSLMYSKLKFWFSETSEGRGKSCISSRTCACQ